MFSKELERKAIEDPLWRRATALGRKVASKITVEDLLKTSQKEGESYV